MLVIRVDKDDRSYSEYYYQGEYLGMEEQLSITDVLDALGIYYKTIAKRRSNG